MRSLSALPGVRGAVLERARVGRDGRDRRRRRSLDPIGPRVAAAVLQTRMAACGCGHGGAIHRPYANFGARGFLVMALLCAGALPLTRGLRAATIDGAVMTDGQQARDGSGPGNAP
jgi:hypothetical protein